MMQGRRRCRLLIGEARAMACGSNPRALPDFRPSGGGRPCRQNQSGNVNPPNKQKLNGRAHNQNPNGKVRPP